MQKTEFVKLVAEKSGVSQKDVSAVLSAFDDVMLEKVFAEEDSVRMGIGTFKGVTKPATKARKGRNPATGEEITIAAKPEAHGQPKIVWSKAAKE